MAENKPCTAAPDASSDNLHPEADRASMTPRNGPPHPPKLKLIIPEYVPQNDIYEQNDSSMTLEPRPKIDARKTFKTHINWNKASIRSVRKHRRASRHYQGSPYPGDIESRGDMVSSSTPLLYATSGGRGGQAGKLCMCDDADKGLQKVRDVCLIVVLVFVWIAVVLSILSLR